MEKAKISTYQFFTLILLFELGTSILLPVGIKAHQDAWLAILLGMIGSFILYSMYYRLYLYYPHLLPTKYMQEILGRFAGKTLAFSYLLYFAYFAARNLRDFGEMLLTFAYPDSPLFIVNALLILVVMYTLTKGIEVLSRAAELLLLLVYFLAIAGFFLIVASGLLEFNQLKPVLEEGMLPVVKAVVTQTLYFPFGQVIVFTMIFPYICNSQNIKVIGLCALGLSGINLAITMIINISVLGVSLTSRSVFPLLTTVESIQLADFLERLDVFFMFLLITSGFIKISIFFYAFLIGTADLFNIQKTSQLTYPLGLIILFLSVGMASNIQEHFYEGKDIASFFFHIPFQLLFPVLLLIVAFFKNKKKLKKT
ncbi:GerAB/ArcD/ProY family transporter [Priestia aryabhattai]